MATSTQDPSFSNEILQTVSGATTTAWLPLTSPWISIAACSSQLYGEPNTGPVIAFDPFYGSAIASNQIPCLPTEVTVWWDHPGDGKTVYALGPTFVCPAAYSAVQTILVNSATQEILCCPTSYTLNKPLTSNPPSGFPSQCYSSPTSGEVVTYMTQTEGNSSWTPFTRTIEVDSFPIFAVHVNGFIVMSTTSSFSSSTSPTASAVVGPITPSSAPPTSTPNTTYTPSSSTSSGLSGGAAAGVGIGAAAGLILVAIVGFYLYRRRKRLVKPHDLAMWQEANTQTPMAVFPSETIQTQELPNKNPPTAYEIG